MVAGRSESVSASIYPDTVKTSFLQIKVLKQELLTEFPVMDAISRSLVKTDEMVNLLGVNIVL